MPIVNPYGGYLGGAGATEQRGQSGVVNPYAGFIGALANQRQDKTSKEQDALLAQIQKLVLLQGMQGMPRDDGATANIASPPKVSPPTLADVYDPETYIRNTRRIESGDDPTKALTAFNQKSGATGPDQFIQPTWAAIQKQAPQLELTDDGRTNDAQSLRAMKYLTEQNAGILKQALGRNPTHAELYTAHLLGPGWATAILKAPETPVAAILPPSFIEANPMLKGATGQTLLQSLGPRYNR